MAAKRQMPDLSNATQEMLIDELGKMSLVENEAKALRKYYKEALCAKLGIDPSKDILPVVVPGDTIFDMDISQYPSSRLDQAKIKETFDQDWIDKYSKNGIVTTFRPKLKDGVNKPIVNELIDRMKQELDLED